MIDALGDMGITSPKQPQLPSLPYIRITTNRYMLNRTNNKMENGIVNLRSCRLDTKRSPKYNSKPINILADHSASVQFRKVVSTMVQPNCSSVGILEIPENINTIPMENDIRTADSDFAEIVGMDTCVMSP